MTMTAATQRELLQQHTLASRANCALGDVDMVNQQTVHLTFATDEYENLGAARSLPNHTKHRGEHG
ncbi:MAG: hypothetical protein JWN04_3429 [Myxococcaceae bacterium]|nr:hypothetical protein [Myxococcaceae bacterium]